MVLVWIPGKISLVPCCGVRSKVVPSSAGGMGIVVWAKTFAQARTAKKNIDIFFITKI
jgi:hypothetical protein